ncbi:sensor histidine kinase [Gandjariella thermophila]|uniref:histidine kinase n=1 Tax=Gandjariella thermophila TaxID=1931992 RepID=A0A4D4JC21_9PSEU|nr:ATP-binding protein [Gandjariella thermophila]GDY32892.1 ATPase [Gandjariella thermophila]
MSELPPPNTRANHWHGQGSPGQSSGIDAAGELRSHLLRLAVLPAALLAVIGAATVALLLADRSGETRVLVIAVAVAAAVLVVVMAASRANATARAMGARVDEARQAQQDVDTLRMWTARFAEEIQRFARQARDGERPVPRGPQPPPVEGSHPFAFLAHELQQAQHAAEVVISQATGTPMPGDPDQRVGVFVNLARRLQSLVHRAIQKLDELEHQVEDPDLLKGLFFVDHLATGVRRQAESLAVLGGVAPRRQWSSPVNMYTVLRSAVAEVEQYARVKVIPPVEGTLRGHAVADIIHLVAELVENATMFSAPETEVTVRAQMVAAGLAIEIDDRGLGMPIEDQRRINDLLAAPGHIDLGELLQDGRIGLCVVAELARRHGVAVRLQNNIYGGIQATVVLPHRLLGDASPDADSEQPAREPASLGNGRVAGALPAAPGNGSSVHSTSATATASAPAPAATATASSSAPELPRRVPAESHGKWPAADTLDARAANITAASAAQRRHESETPASQPDRAAGNGSGAHPARGTGAAGGSHGAHARGDDARPRLPQRRERTTYLVPELLESRPASEPAAGHNPGLMAAFQRGIDRGSGAEGDDPPADRTS